MLTVDAECNVKFSIDKDISCVHRVCCVSKVSFPAPVLIGMDLLRRFNFKFVHNLSPHKSYLMLQGRKLFVTYTDAQSLCITAISNPATSSMSYGDSNKVHALRTVLCPPHTGRFVEGRVPRSFSGSTAFLTGVSDSVLVPKSLVSVNNRCVFVWVVNTDSRPKMIKNGTCLAEVSEADAVVAAGDGEDGSRQGSDSVEDSASDRNEALEEGDELNEFNDDFDEYHGTLDFGYEDSEFTIFPDIDLRPSADATGNVSACASAAMLGVNLNHLDELQQHHLCKVIAKFPKLFSDDPMPGHVPGVEHRIVINDSKPVCVRQWRLPEKTKAFIRNECDKMRDEGVIEPSSSPWLSPVVLVRKKNGTTRFCIDFRGLNAVTVADSYPMPRVDELIDELISTLKMRIGRFL
ncbi:uncharacterized protein LOC125047574 [Penaeus chinensis]|uniref:uncharacterized protein LOC125047574 n=1 Tax=Penaeus chinensis TaxID=139456 RepID=UPI001FB6B53F|nr:uncharacterized protein LOC125047574 [Penaeus chinensis]